MVLEEGIGLEGGQGEHMSVHCHMEVRNLSLVDIAGLTSSIRFAVHRHIILSYHHRETSHTYTLTVPTLLYEKSYLVP